MDSILESIQDDPRVKSPRCGRRNAVQSAPGNAGGWYAG